MPFAATYKEEEDPNKKQGSYNVSGQGSSDFSSQNLPGQDAGGSSQKSSGQYSNIQSYLDANKSQADDMGQKITADADKKGSEATQAISSFESKAPKVEAYDPNEALGRVTSLSADEKAKYQTNRNTGGYSGPQSLEQAEGYQDVSQKAQAGIQANKDVGTEQGQQQLLKSAFGRPSYTGGENKLDQVLLQNSPGSKAALENLSQKYSGLEGLFNNAVGKVGTGINEANQTALANKNATLKAEEDYKNNLINPIKQRAQLFNQDRTSLVNRVTDDAADETLSDESLGQLGLSEGQNLYNLDLRNYITPDLTEANVNNVANADERSRYAALSGLLGDQSMNELTADGKEIKPLTLSDRLKTDVDKKKAEYENAYKTSKGIVPGVGDATYINEYTPEYLENVIIPQKKEYARTHPWGSIYTDAMGEVNLFQNALDSWKNKFQPNRVIKKG